MREGVGGVTTLNGRYNSLPKLSDFCFLKGAFEAVVLCLRHISQSLEQGVSVSRTSWSRRTMTLSVPSWPPEYFQLGSWGFDYILWVLIVTDPAHRWLHFIRAREGRILPVEPGHLGRSALAVRWPGPSRDGEGHVSSSYSPWVVWLSTYLHLSAGASFSLHPSPPSLSLRRLNILLPGLLLFSKTP